MVGVADEFMPLDGRPMSVGEERPLADMHGHRRGDHWPWCMVVGEETIGHGAWTWPRRPLASVNSRGVATSGNGAWPRSGSPLVGNGCVAEESNACFVH